MAPQACPERVVRTGAGDPEAGGEGDGEPDLDYRHAGGDAAVGPSHVCRPGGWFAAGAATGA